MNDNVYFRQTEIFDYKIESFNPSEIYKEGLDIEIKSDKRIYHEMRNLFHDMGLDNENYGKETWNPFKDFIKKGNNVIIKPNLVKHINEIATKEGNTDSLITNFSVIRPVIDYCIIALKGTGNIILGDAPVQGCNFKEVIKLNCLEEGIEKYNSKGYKIDLMDFRKNDNEQLECQIVSVNENSSFIEVDKYSKKYAITNYNLKYMRQHHHDGIHEYLIPKCVLEADVIINMPKPKTHRKAGMTACMKNFVGINSKKEYLPHHRNGSIYEDGDEYPENSISKKIQSNVKNYTYTHSKIVSFMLQVLYFINKFGDKNRFLEGSWYGNDTIWRTILDINKIVLYADRSGNLQNKKQRIIFNLADMIISGEKEGPLLPSNKEVGIIVGSFNQLNMDKTICEIMGFDYNDIKYIVNGYKLDKFRISFQTNYKNYINGKEINDLKKYNKNFQATDGWKDLLNKSGEI